MIKHAERWKEIALEIREELGILPHEVSMATTLALIEVETNGDVMEISPSGSHYGLLQGNQGYVIDCCEELGIPVFPAKHLLGDGRMSIRCMMAYQRRYNSRTGWRTRSMAALHHGGPGYARHVQRLMRQGMDEMDAIREVATYDKMPSRTPIYVERVLAARKDYR